MSNGKYPVVFFAVLIIVWQCISSFGLVPAFMLPSPVAVAKAFVTDLPLLAMHSVTTLGEAALGLALSVVMAVLFAVLMDRFAAVKKTLYPVAVVTQTVPTIAVAPLLVLWMGYGVAPKIAVIFITCFFPVLIGLYGGLSSVEPAMLRLMKSMGATYLQMLTHVKFPYALGAFFSGLRISATYAVVGAVISEWLGGNSGLGVYMTRVRKGYAFDKMFAVIILITIISLVLIRLVDALHRALTPWERAKSER
jgi:ABC-type nitrate/sulfonate/bicarbonate transport system permease component